MTCPLCLSNNIQPYYHDKNRDYWQCQHCQLVFVSTKQRLSVQAEKAIYDQHQNSPEDSGYRWFLNKLLIPLMQKLESNSMGLDFGSGPGPTLSIIMAEHGYQMVDFDIFYANHPELLNYKYDFITCTEVIEHLYHPHQELIRISNMLKPKGLLGIMTKRLINKDKFKTWHYKNDPTHVCFYSDYTMEYIAHQWNYELEIINSDTVIMQLR